METWQQGSKQWGRRAECHYQDICAWVQPVSAQAAPSRLKDTAFITSFLQPFYKAHHSIQPHGKTTESYDFLGGANLNIQQDEKERTCWMLLLWEQSCWAQDGKTNSWSWDVPLSDICLTIVLLSLLECCPGACGYGAIHSWLVHCVSFFYCICV